MKRIMFVLAAIAMAVSAQAAAVQWSTGSFNVPGTGGTGYGGKVAQGATGYSAVIKFFTDALGANEITGLTGLSTTTVTMNGMANKTGDSFEAGVTYYTQLVITYGDSELKSAIEAFTTPAPGSSDANANLNFLSGSGFTASGSKYPTGGWKSVPEPTSGLLMLVGASLLALRRRRA